MNDNEIIKALNYCCGNIKNNDGECNKDMCYQVNLPESRDEGTRFCRQWLIKDALDLINRQKAEIERLQHKNSELQHKILNCDANNDDYYDNLVSNAKSKAIKEFAERLKETITNAINTYYNSNGGGYYLAEDVIEDIDDLVKEMTEVEE